VESTTASPAETTESVLPVYAERFTPADAAEDGTITLTNEMFTAQFDKDAAAFLKQDDANAPLTLAMSEIDARNAASEDQAAVIQEILDKGGKVFDLSLAKENGEAAAFSDGQAGQVTITVPYEASGSTVYVFWINDSGERVDMNAVYDAAAKTVSFKAPHFSLYSIEEELPQTGITARSTMLAALALLMLAAGCAAVYASGMLRRKEQ
jgi:LPXTG-motif cell wall-anchored protein